MAGDPQFIPCTIRQLQGQRLIEAAATALRVNPRNKAVVLNRVESVAIDLSDRSLTAILTDRKWRSDGVQLTVSFLDSPPQALRKSILAQMNSWGDTANVRFDLTEATGQVRIARVKEGYWSYLGTDILEVPEDEATMNLHGITLQTPEMEVRRVVCHETGHTLGFPHQHLARKSIERLLEWKVIDFYAATHGWSAEQTRAQILMPMCALASTSSEESIMCHQIPASLTKDGRSLRGGNAISAEDARFARACYPK